MPPAHRGPTGSPMDRWTDASPSAISSGFQNAMMLGPQPRLDGPAPSTGLAQSTTAGDFHSDDEDDDDDDDFGDGDSPANGAAGSSKKRNTKAAKGKKGAAAAKSKDAKAAQHRKEQNRAAQREFRQRKQQYIRALEARVELLSSDHDTQVNRLRYALRHLLAENNSLRTIVGSLAQFIGSRAIGGCLHEAGLTRQQLEATMNSSSEKVMSEAWANWPGAGECEALKQIRKESNIPPEGLPESKLVNYFRTDNPASAFAPSSDKKKRTRDDLADKDTKRKRKGDGASTPSAGGAANTTSFGSNQSSPATVGAIDPSNQHNAVSKVFASSPQNMAAGDTQQPWDQQQQQLPPEFWQPSTSLGQNMRSDVDTTFAQTLLGGFGGVANNADMSTLAAIAGPMFSNGTINQSLFSPQDVASFNALIPSGGASSTEHSAIYSPFGFAPSIPNYGGGSGAPAPGSSSIASVDGSKFVAGGVECSLLTSGEKATPGQLQAIRRRSARVIAQVNRIWAKRGATNFLNLPADYQLDESDMSFLQESEATNPHVKIACIQLPNRWDEGDLNDTHHAEQTSGAPEHKTANQIEKQAENFLQLSYHLRNHHANPSYQLPPIIKPTALQKSTPHDLAIDFVPLASLRDRLIQNKTLDVHSVIIDLVRFFSPVEGDINNERSWTLTLPFLIRYPELVDASMLANTNRQRVAHGQLEVTMDEVWKEHQRFTEYTQAKLKEMS